MSGNNSHTSDTAIPPDDINVKLDRMIHEKLKVVADIEKTSVKSLLNYIVSTSLDRMELLNWKYPHLRFLKNEGDTILIADLKQNKIARICGRNISEQKLLVGDFGLYCEVDETARCEHCWYCYLIPEGLELLKPLWGYPQSTKPIKA